MEKSVDCTWRQCPNHKPQMSIVYSINGEKKNVQYKIINPTKKSAMPHEIGKSPFDGFSQQSLQSSMYSSGISQLPMFAAGQLLSHLGTRRFGLPSAVLVPCDPHLKTSWHLWHQMVKIHHDIINCWFIIKFIWFYFSYDLEVMLGWFMISMDIYGMIYLCKTRGIPCSSFPILVSMDCLRWGNIYRKHQPSGNIRNPGFLKTPHFEPSIHGPDFPIGLLRTPHPTGWWGSSPAKLNLFGSLEPCAPGNEPWKFKRLLAGFREVVRHVDEDAFLEPTTCPRATWKGLAPLNLKKNGNPSVFWSKFCPVCSKHHHLLYMSKVCHQLWPYHNW